MKQNNLSEYFNNHFCPLQTDVDSLVISKNALKSVLPEILTNELTQRQRNCLNMRFSQLMTQEQIAEELKLSQPTVSRHLKKAVDIVANRLNYCMSALDRATADWLKNLE